MCAIIFPQICQLQKYKSLDYENGAHARCVVLLWICLWFLRQCNLNLTNSWVFLLPLCILEQYYRDTKYQQSLLHLMGLSQILNTSNEW